MATTHHAHMNSGFERVYTVTEYYDGPRGGVADFGGAPHVYRSLFLDVEDEYDSDRYELSPLSSDALALALEDWAIWERFESAYRTGQVTWSGVEEEWGALPDELARKRELLTLLKPVLVIDPAARVMAH